jgi:hypothetical protein
MTPLAQDIIAVVFGLSAATMLFGSIYAFWKILGSGSYPKNHKHAPRG